MLLEVESTAIKTEKGQGSLSVTGVVEKKKWVGMHTELKGKALLGIGR